MLHFSPYNRNPPTCFFFYSSLLFSICTFFLSFSLPRHNIDTNPPSLPQKAKKSQCAFAGARSWRQVFTKHPSAGVPSDGATAAASFHAPSNTARVFSLFFFLFFRPQCFFSSSFENIDRFNVGKKMNVLNPCELT